MDIAAYTATVHQARDAITRARAHVQLAKVLGATWPLKAAETELVEAGLLLALAAAEAER